MKSNLCIEEDENNDNMSGDGGDDQDDGEGKQEYIKKEFVARPYVSETGVQQEVEQSIVKDTRPLLKMRISRPRKEYGQDGFNFVDKEGGEFFQDLKSVTKGIVASKNKKKVLDSGFQAAHQIKRISTQTYFGRSVNKSTQYQPEDFIAEMSNFKDDDTLEDKLDKFIDRVAFRVEEALQSNEIINVFQDDFEMLATELEAQAGKINSVKMTPRTFSESDYCNQKRVSCIKFHPTKPFLVAMSMIEYLKFHERAAVSGKSFESNVLIMNFSDNHIITLAYVLETPIEVTSIEFHPENPNVLIGGCLNGQVIIWDLTSTEHKIQAGPKAKEIGAGGDDDNFQAAPGDEDDEKQQTIVKMRHMTQSSIIFSHKEFVADITFVPCHLNVDKRSLSEGKYTHFMSVSEDGVVNIWDSRLVDKEVLKKFPDTIWKPFLRLDIFK